MTWTAQEKDDLNTELESRDQVMRLTTQSGTNVYQLCQLVPITSVSASEMAAFALQYGITIASP